MKAIYEKPTAGILSGMRLLQITMRGFTFLVVTFCFCAPSQFGWNELELILLVLVIIANFSSKQIFYQELCKVILISHHFSICAAEARTNFTSLSVFWYSYTTQSFVYLFSYYLMNTYYMQNPKSGIRRRKGDVTETVRENVW